HWVLAFPGAELGRQLTEPGRQPSHFLGRELPGDTSLGQVPVGICQRYRGLPRTTQPIQRHDLRSRTPPQQGAQVSEQVLPAGQQCWWQGQPQRSARAHSIGGLLRQLGQDPGAQSLNQPSASLNSAVRTSRETSSRNASTKASFCGSPISDVLTSDMLV